MKKLLILFTLCLASICASAEVIYFRTTAFCSSTYNYQTYRWNNWSSWSNSNMNLTIDLTNDIVKIYSPKTQTYRVTQLVQKGYDSDGDYKVEFKFIDQDGDSGTMWLYQRSSGTSEIYIIFSNVRWCYRVVRT